MSHTHPPPSIDELKLSQLEDEIGEVTRVAKEGIGYPSNVGRNPVDAIRRRL
ncbi:hypothetical protein ACFQY0_16185 [Haloferula chungangensis]|uniref:Uncharacterized protein n=1 Tax=Haloferula chungangensis TaxID=1048331 RepID=A0ABW2LAY4_9BACT